MPIEWTGRLHISALPHQDLCLPLMGGVSRMTREGAVRQCSSDGLAIVGEKAFVISVERKA